MVRSRVAPIINKTRAILYNIVVFIRVSTSTTEINRGEMKQVVVLEYSKTMEE